MKEEDMLVIQEPDLNIESGMNEVLQLWEVFGMKDFPVRIIICQVLHKRAYGTPCIAYNETALGWTCAAAESHCATQSQVPRSQPSAE
jgi:hypothetical protein